MLRAQLAGQSGSAALEAVDPVLRPGVQALAFTVWRNLGRAMALRDTLAAKTPPAAVDALLGPGSSPRAAAYVQTVASLQGPTEWENRAPGDTKP